MSQFVHRAWPVRLALLAGIALAASALFAIGRASADEGGPGRGEAVSTSVSNVATGRADAVDATDLQCTTSTSFTDLPGMSETFSFGGNHSRPVIVLFQGTWVSAAQAEAFIWLTIDGVVQPSPGWTILAHEDDASADFETNGFNFISAPLAPGTHTATIQWYSGNGNQVCVVGRSMVVLHK
jgi:hypothetical protein